MNVGGMSSGTTSESRKTPDRTEADTSSKDRDQTASFGDRLVAAARVAEAAALQNLGNPISVDVTEHGCTAVMDTATVLGWSVLFSPRPLVTVYEDSPHILLQGTIDGVQWVIHNGEPAPTQPAPVAEPEPEPAPPADAETVRVPSPRPRRAEA
jgi:hypothetical protein